jgi:hypothetical protein
LKEDLKPIFFKLFHEIQRRERRLKQFYEASIILIAKLDKETTQNENCTSISLMNIDSKIANKILAIEFYSTSNSLYTTIKLVSFQGYKNASTYTNQ